MLLEYKTRSLKPRLEVRTEPQQRAVLETTNKTTNENYEAEPRIEIMNKNDERGHGHRKTKKKNCETRKASRKKKKIVL